MAPREFDFFSLYPLLDILARSAIRVEWSIAVKHLIDEHTHCPKVYTLVVASSHEHLRRLILHSTTHITRRGAVQSANRVEIDDFEVTFAI